MSFPILLYRLGILGLLLAAGVFWTDPLRSSLARHPEELAGVVLLFGFPVVVGLIALFLTPERLKKNAGPFILLLNGVSLLSLVWLMLWCWIWLPIVSGLGNPALAGHLALFHLFGLGLVLAAYVSAWMTPVRGQKAARFVMAAGWAVSYASLVNIWIYAQMKEPPGFLWAPAVGGLLTAVGAFLVFRKIED